MTRLTTIALAAIVVTGAAAGIAAATSKPTKPATVKVRTTKLGKVLVTSSGATLYLFEKDKRGKSACSGACAGNWPPLLTKGRAHAGRGVKASKLGTTRRGDGTTQVTYNGHPLYRFFKDAGKPGSAKGEGVDAFGAEWYVVGPNGAKVEKPGEDKSSGSGGS